jgi:hypothetical protein
MKETQYGSVCNRTEHKEEQVKLRNLRTGQVGYSFGCTMEGETVQIRLENGELDSWAKDECEEA